MKPSRLRRPTASIRQQLLIDITVLVVVLGAAITVAMLLGTRRAVGSLADLIIRLNVESTNAELTMFFHQIAEEMQVTIDHLKLGVIEPPSTGPAADDQSQTQRQFANYFGPLLQRYGYVSGAIVADDKGREMMLVRTPEGWGLRTVRGDSPGDAALWRHWLASATIDSSTQRLEQLDYDPRTRPWFRRAIDAEADGSAALWTEPYIFFTANEPGMTVSRRVELVEGTTHVVALDLLLHDISSFTRNLAVSPRGTVAILSGDGRLIGLPRDAKFDDAGQRESAYLKPPADVGLPELVDAIAALDGREDKLEPVRFESGGVMWWSRDSSFPLDGRQALRVVVLVPEEDLFGHISQLRMVVLTIVALVLLIGVVRAMVVARRFSQPVEALVAQTNRMSAGDLSAGEPIVSHIREIRKLAEAQDTMREGLGAIMRLEKIERDLDLAQEIQQGLLPSSRPNIAGFEIAGWNQPADETGGDYFDWLQHSDGNTAITLADVTGHGIGPALIMAVCRAYMRAATLSHGSDIRGALQRVNGLLRSDIPDGRFVTIVLAFVEPVTSTVRISSAGHGPLFYFEAATQTVHVWDADDVPLGIIDEMNMPEPRAITFARGDMLVLLTDGFIEWKSGADEEFGAARVCDYLRLMQDATPDELITGLYDAVRKFAPDTAQDDDLTAVVLKKV